MDINNWTTKALLTSYNAGKDYWDVRRFNLIARELHRRMRHRREGNFKYKHFE